MNAVTVGATIAAVVAGPPLWGLVASGDLDTFTAFEKVGVVAAGCAVGATMISRLISSYEAERRVARRRVRITVDPVVHEGRPLPAREHPGSPVIVEQALPQPE